MPSQRAAPPTLSRPPARPKAAAAAGLAVLGIAIAVGTATHLDREEVELRKVALERLAEVANARVHEVDHWFDDRVREATGLAGPRRAGDRLEVERGLFEAGYVVSPDGRVLFATAGAPAFDPAWQPEVRAAAAAGPGGVHERHTTVGGRPCVLFLTPLAATGTGPGAPAPPALPVPEALAVFVAAPPKSVLDTGLTRIVVGSADEEAGPGSAAGGRRDASTLAVRRGIEGGGWGVVAEMSVDQALAPMRRERSGDILIAVLAWLLAAALSAALVRRRERARLRSEAGYRALVDALPAAVIAATPDERLVPTFASPQIAAIAGPTPEDVVGDPGAFARIFHPDDCARARAQLAESRDTGETREDEYRLHDRSGGPIHARLRTALARSPDGAPLHVQAILTDVTARREVERALELRQLEQRAILEQANDAIVVTDEEGRILDANARFREWYGFDDADLGRMKLRDLKVGPSSSSGTSTGEQSSQRMRRLAARGSLLIEETHRRRDGSTFPVLVSSRAIEDLANRFVTIIRDTTELRAAEARRRAMLDGVEAAICLLDRKGRIVEANAAFRRHAGEDWPCGLAGAGEGAEYAAVVEAAAARGSGDAALAGAALAVRAVLRGERARFEHEHEDGRHGWHRSCLVAVTSVRIDGRLEGAVVAHYDVSPVRRAAQAAAASESRYRATVQAMAEGVMLIDADATIVDLNEASAKIVGLPREQCLGLKMTDRVWRLTREDGSELSPDGAPGVRCLASGTAERGVVVGHRRSDGRQLWVEMNTEPLALDGGMRASHAVITLTDVTERRRAEALRQALAEIDHQIVGRLDLEGILGAVCRGVVGLGCSLSWIGFKRPDGRVEIGTRAGEAAAMFDELEVRWDDTPPGQGPTGTAIRTGEVVVVADAATDPLLASWRSAPGGHGLRSVVVIPLRAGRDGEVIGVLGAWSSRPAAFDRLLVDELRALAAQAAVAMEAARTHERLHESEERYRTIVETTREGIWAVDADDRTTYVNPQMAAMLGYSVDEMVGRSVLEFHDDEVKARAAADLERRRQGFGEHVETRLRHKDGRGVWVLMAASPIINGRYRGTIAAITDITERRAAEEAMRRVNAAIEQAQESIVITDAQGRIEYVNPAFCRASGYTAAEALGRTARLVKSGVHDDSFYRDLWDTIVAGRTWEGVITNRRKDGALYQVSQVIGPVRDAAGRTVNFVAVGRDVTRENRLEAQLLQAQKLEAVGQLAGGVAHDFNNALAGIMGYVDLALMDLGAEDPVRPMLLEVHRGADRAASIARQLLIFSRRQPVELVPLDLNGIVQGLVKMLRRLIGEDIALETTLCGGLGVVRGDGGQLEQVITNLCVNARDAMPRGGRLEVSTANVQDAGGRSVLLSVRDTGCGMTPEVKAHLFEPFFTTKPKGKGTGLGLAVVHGIVSKHGGRIEVESEPGLGTTLRVYLPRVDALVDAAPKAEAQALPGGTATLLIVEDDDGVRGVAARSLERLGYRVLVARGGAEALAAADEHDGPIDLLLTDVVMPGQDGRELAADLWARRPDLRTLFMSGYTGEKLDDRGILESGAAFLPKPFTLGALALKVREVLDRRPTQASACSSVTADA